MKKIKQTSVFTLSALSAALLCQTATSYASDIEIYKAPTTGGAIIQLILDMSSSMQTPVNNSGGYLNPINKDFGITCATNRNDGNNTTYGSTRADIAYARTDTRTFQDSATPAVTHEYTFTGRYCNVLKSAVDTWVGQSANLAKANLIKKSCTLFSQSTTQYYRCPDRLTSLKHSIFDLIVGTADVERLPDTAYVGITTFPTTNIRTPVLLNDRGRKQILDHVDGLTTANGTPISEGYTNATKTLLDFTTDNNAAAACAGFGLYFLTDGEPLDDNRGTARTTVNSYLKSDQQITTTQCNGSIGLTESDKNKQALSWSCVEPIAKKLREKHNTHNLDIKTAVVGFGGDFSFKNSSGQPVQFTTTMTETQAANLFTGAIQKAAARAATAGKGGWFSADNSEDIVNSVQNFVNSIKIPIPAITTGSATIPQDSLNTVAVQPYAYFPQFKPQPSETFQLWSGNLKKFKVVNSVLEDKDGLKVFNDTNGQLNTTVKDLWVKGLTADSELNNVGGVLGKLKLKATSTAFNRKVYTNSGAAISPVVDEAYIKGAWPSRKYLLGLLGYDLSVSDLNVATAPSRLTDLSPTKTLRNIGAVMHSTPVLLTQEGKITYVDETAGGVTTSKMSTATRDDYLLFGTTQGVLHVVKAGVESDAAASYAGGDEVFAFVPQETLANQPTALLNEAESGTNGMSQLYYGVDGPWVAHTEYVYNGTDDKFYVKDGTKLGKQWVYGGMRMGGRSYYALDLTDISDPKIKFRIDPTSSMVYTSAKKADGTNITSYSYSHLAKMGQSWSKPVITNVQWEGKRRLVMFVGGGYDPGYETFNYVQDATTNTINTTTGRGAGIGAGVFMFDANTGEPLWSTYESATKGDGDDLKYSIVNQIKTIDRDGDGDVDHLYFGDLGGQVFRVDLNSSHPVLNISPTATAAQRTAAITASKASFANNIIRILDVHKANGLSPRFYEAPGFSIYNGTNGIYAVVSIGSGNRSNPLLGKIVNSNYIVSGETAALNAALSNDAIYNLFDTDVVKKEIPSTYTYVLRDTTPSALAVVNDTNRELGVKPQATVSTPNPQPANKIDFTGKKGWYYAFTSSTDRKAVEKVQGDIIIVDNDQYVTTFDAEAIGTTEACGAGIYGASKAHRFCMPYGQCSNGDAVTSNTLDLGKGILGITLGGGTDGNANARSIVAPVNSRNPSTNKLLAALYKSDIRLTPLSWYEKN